MLVYSEEYSRGIIIGANTKIEIMESGIFGFGIYINDNLIYSNKDEDIVRKLLEFIITSYERGKVLFYV